MRKSFFKFSLGAFFITFLIGGEVFSAFLKFDSKKWSAYTSFGYLYDSNISLNPQRLRRDAGLTHQQGSALVGQFKPVYATPLKDWGMISIANSFYGQWYLDAYQRRYSTFEYALTPQFSRSSVLWGKELVWKLPFTYAAIFSGKERSAKINLQLYNTWDFTPSFTYYYSGKCNTTLDARVGYQESKNGIGINDRDGYYWAAGVSQGFLLSIIKDFEMNWDGGYHYDRLNTKGTQFDERSHIFHLKTAFPFFLKTSMGVGGEFIGRRFLTNTRSFSEHGVSGDLNLVKIFPNNIGAALHTRITKQTANINQVTFNQGIVMAKMFYTF